MNNASQKYYVNKVDGSYGSTQYSIKVAGQKEALLKVCGNGAEALANANMIAAALNAAEEFEAAIGPRGNDPAHHCRRRLRGHASAVARTLPAGPHPGSAENRQGLAAA